MENNTLKNGDVLIIGGHPYMIIDYQGKLGIGEDKNKHCLLDLINFHTDCWCPKADFKTGDVVFDGIDEQTDAKVEAIIPRERLNINYRLA